MLLFNDNIILLIVSTLIATISAQTCPQIWWPLSISNSFLNEVIRSDNINTITNVAFVTDRIASPTNINGLYIKGANTATVTNNAGDNTKYISFLTLPKDAYLSSTSFTITFWINAPLTPAVTASKTARVIDFSDAASKTNGLAVYLTSGSTTNYAAVGLEVVTSDGGALTKTVSDNGPGFAPATWTHVAITVSTSGSTITTAIYYNGGAITTLNPSATTITKLPPTSTIFATNFIGKGTSPTANDLNLDAYLNDVKMFNSALSATLVASQYTSEKSTRTYTCSSSSINPQYFYIVLLAILGSFF